MPIDKYVAAAKGDLNKAARAVAFDLYNRLLIRSPVLTGRFRGNWQIGLNAVPGGVIAVEGIGQTAIEAQAKVGSFKIGDTINMTNNLPYAVALELGHSGQAPAGVVRITVKEFKGIVKKAAASV